MPRRGGMVSDLGGLVARLPAANGVDKVREMQDGCVRLIRELQILWSRLGPYSL